MKKQYLLVLLVSGMTMSSLAQTQIVAYKSHSGNMEHFEYSNDEEFGMAPVSFRLQNKLQTEAPLYGNHMMTYSKNIYLQKDVVGSGMSSLFEKMRAKANIPIEQKGKKEEKQKEPKKIKPKKKKKKIFAMAKTEIRTEKFENLKTNFDYSYLLFLLIIPVLRVVNLKK